MVALVFDPTSVFSGSRGKHALALFYLEPASGDYSGAGSDSDVNPSTGVTQAAALGVVLVDPTTGKAYKASSSGGGGGGTPVTPAALQGTGAVVTGGTAVAVTSGATNGGYVTNPPNAASQFGSGSFTENLYVDMVTSPASTDATAVSSTTILMPGQSFTWPATTSGVTVKINAATAGHRYSGAQF